MAESGILSLPAIQTNSEHSGTVSLTASPTVLKITLRSSPPDDSLSKNGSIDFRFRSKALAWVVLHSIYQYVYRTEMRRVGGVDMHGADIRGIRGTALSDGSQTNLIAARAEKSPKRESLFGWLLSIVPPIADGLDFRWPCAFDMPT
jgi:hypothetical protein